MVLYELFCISRADLERAATIALFKRIGHSILDHDGVLRKVCTTGIRPLPYRMRNQGEYLYEGQYWSVLFNLPPKATKSLSKFLQFEKDVVRSCLFKQAESLEQEAKSLLTNK